MTIFAAHVSFKDYIVLYDIRVATVKEKKTNSYDIKQLSNDAK